MFSIKSLFQAVQSWRRRGGPKTKRRSEIALERLDHRQLMTVNFTGNALIDIPATGLPGNAILADNGTVRHPGIPSDLQSIIKVSGLDLNGIRMQYDASGDVLSIALQQPDNQKTGQLVLAGDTDNNGNGATVDPAVLALRPSFIDFGFLGGSESMGAFLDLNNDSIPDVVAGISNDVGAGKLYQVADAVVNPDPVIAARTIPRFGAQLLNNTGATFLSNDPAKPSFEFNITNFSKLYLAKTGTAFRTDSLLQVGAFGTSNDDDGISEAFFPGQTVNFNLVPPPPPVCPPVPVPPLRPPVLINPHAGSHVNTAHPTDVRVNVFGSAGFNTDAIIPSSVRLGGAAPISTFPVDLNGDKFPDRTFVFRGSDIELPGGITRATVTGTLTDGTTFQSSKKIFNRNDSFYTQAEINARDERQAKEGFDAENPPLTPSQEAARAQARVRAKAHDIALETAMVADNAAFASAMRSTVKIATRHKVGAAAASAVSVDSTMATSVVGAAAGSQASSASLLAETAKRAPVAQAAAPVTVSIPRRNSITVPDVTSTGKKVTGKTLAGGFNRAGFARPAMARA